MRTFALKAWRPMGVYLVIERIFEFSCRFARHICMNLPFNITGRRRMRGLSVVMKMPLCLFLPPHKPLPL
jgi:hypothetical protein